MLHLKQIKFKLLKSTSIPMSWVQAKKTKEREICAMVDFCIFNSVS